MHRFLVILFFVTGMASRVCQAFVATPPTARPRLIQGSRPSALYVSTPPFDDPTIEAESLTVLAHVVMDFSGFAISPSQPALRVCAILGRILTLTAEYIANHGIHTEELAIQLFLIAVAVKELVSGPVAPTPDKATATEAKPTKN